MSDSEITVVIPSYRRPVQLRHAVSTVLEEVTAGLEVIVVDDASPGGAPRAEDFDDARVRVIRRQDNGGVAAAQNSGLAAARGRFVAFIHSDDEWVAGRLGRQLAMLDDSDAAAVESATIRSSRDGERIARPRMGGRTHEDLLHRRVRDLHVSGWLFRRAVLLDIQGFDEQLRCYEDLDLLIRLTARHRILVDEGPPVARIEVGSEDRLGSSSWMRDGRLRLLRKYLDQLDAPGGLPPGWRDWCTQVAADLIASDSDHRGEAADLLRRARRASTRRAISTLPLVVASHLPPSIGSWIASRRRSVWDRPEGGHR